MEQNTKQRYLNGKIKSNKFWGIHGTTGSCQSTRRGRNWQLLCLLNLPSDWKPSEVINNSQQLQQALVRTPRKHAARKLSSSTFQQVLTTTRLPKARKTMERGNKSWITPAQWVKNTRWCKLWGNFYVTWTVFIEKKISGWILFFHSNDTSTEQQMEVS